MPLRKRLSWACALLVLAGPALADEVGELVEQAKIARIGKSCRPETADRFCSSEESCLSFCRCACTFDHDNWGKVRHETKCPGAPRSGTGMLAFDDPALLDLPNMGPYIVGTGGKKATQAVIDGLRRLKTYLAQHADGQDGQPRYRVRVKNCYRPAVGDPTVGDGDTEKECGLILAADYMLQKPLSAKDRAKWKMNRNPNKKGLAWPGATPHSGGVACDLALIDSDGNDSFDWRAGVDDPNNPVPHSSIDPQLASRLLDEAVTNPTVGGRRLNFEAWHYEWGGTTNCRCVAPDCADHHWPPEGTGKCS